MQVILTEDVKSLGKKGTIVKINDNYARNYIIPRRLGVEATKANINDLKLKNSNEQKLLLAKVADSMAIREAIDGQKVTISVKAGKDGKVFGSVTGKEVAAALKSKFGVDIDRKKIVMETIKTLGISEIKIKLHQDIQALVKVEVVPHDA